MSQTQTTYPLIRLLSIGNSINLAVYLYRYHLKQYFKLALIAHLWLLVPIYGWAKFYATSALISRLVFCELIGQRESLKEAKSKIYPQMWNFLIAGILVFIIVVIWVLIFFIAFSLGVGILTVLFPTVFGQPKTYNPANPFGDISPYSLMLFSVVISIFLSPLWFYSRLFITELPLAIENKSNAFKTLRQNWKLTKGFRFHLLGIISIAYSVTLPLQILVWHGLGRILGLIIRRIIEVYPLQQMVIAYGFLVILSIITGIITMPFWQALKATVYYDLRCRKEGLDLQLHQGSKI